MNHCLSISNICIGLHYKDLTVFLFAFFFISIFSTAKHEHALYAITDFAVSIFFFCVCLSFHITANAKIQGLWVSHSLTRFRYRKHIWTMKNISKKSVSEEKNHINETWKRKNSEFIKKNMFFFCITQFHPPTRFFKGKRRKINQKIEWVREKKVFYLLRVVWLIIILIWKRRR